VGDFAPAVDGIVEDSEGIAMPGRREFVVPFLPEVQDVLGVADEGHC
jgi:hypothetical protein